ncbi:hypothetical protein TNCV_4441841 [Trichonephila clavipes]|nr:hypothetical protein TNCV_4441841 [Trichonephila clavipes]
METTPEMDLDIELINGLDDPTPVNEQPLPIDDSRPGTPHLTNCQKIAETWGRLVNQKCSNELRINEQFIWVHYKRPAVKDSEHVKPVKSHRKLRSGCGSPVARYRTRGLLVTSSNHKRPAVKDSEHVKPVKSHRKLRSGCGSPVVRYRTRGLLVTSSIQVP